MKTFLKSFYITAAVFLGLIALTGCSKSLKGTYKPVETEKPGIIDRFLGARPTLKFNPTHVQVSRSGSNTVVEYEYRIVDGMVEIIMPSDGEKEIWRLAIEKDGSLSTEGKLWKKTE
jgi:hypothetical protein